MQKSVRYILTVLLLGSFLLSACAGAAPQGDDSGGSPDANSNEVVDVNGNDNDSAVNENTNESQENNNNDDSQGNGNDNSNGSSGDEIEFHGVVEALTTASINIDGVVYYFADFTEFKDLISVGDQVKIHIIVNADGTFTIREIELSSGDDDNSNGNSNLNSNDDDSNDNSNGNSNDDDDDDDKDDDKDDDNSNDD